MRVFSLTSRWDDTINDRIDERVEVEIPEGSWAVIVKVQTNLNEGADGEYVYRSDDTRVEVVAGEHTQLVIKSTCQNGWLNQTLLIWSHTPFVVIESWESPMNGKWIHMACRVGKRGLSKTLPELNLPEFHTSFAGLHVPDERAGKWCRLVELCEGLGLDPKNAVLLHKPHFEGYEAGMHVVRGKDPNELAQAETCDNIWTCPDTYELVDSDLTQIWVRKRFALVIAYFSLIGWHTEEVKVA